MDPQPGDLIPRPDLGPTHVQLVAPKRCPNGHPLVPGNVTAGWLPCRCAGWDKTGHNTWRCLTCDEHIYVPPHDPDFVTYPGAEERWR